MSVLDELRDAMELWDVANSGFSPQQVAVDMMKLLDAFEQAHPGLVDHSVPCDDCGKPCAWQASMGVLTNDPKEYGSLYLCLACAKKRGLWVPDDALAKP